MTTLYLYDIITNPVAERLVASLEALAGQPVTLRINCYGGDIHAGFAVANAVQRHGQVTVEIDGLAASAATMPCCIAHTRMAENALLMIHGPLIEIPPNPGFIQADDAESMAQSLRIMRDKALAMYAGKTKRPAAEILPMIEGHIAAWFTAQDALEFGLVDEITAEVDDIVYNTPEGVELKMPRKIKAMTDKQFLSIAEIKAQCAAAGDHLLAKVLGEQDNVSPLKMTQRVLENRIENAQRIRTLGQLVGGKEEGFEALMETFLRANMTSQQVATALLDHKAEKSDATAVDSSPPASHLADPVSYGGYGRKHFVEAAIDAIALRQGAKLADPHPAAADLAGRSIMDLAMTCIDQSGRDKAHGGGFVSMRNPAGVIKAAMSTSDFPHLLAGGTVRTLRATFEDLVNDHRRFVQPGDMANFKPGKSINLSAYPGLDHKPEGGEIRYGTITEHAETVKLDTYAKGLTFTREAMVNDDLDGFGSLTMIAGHAAARLERDLVFRVLTDNPLMSDGVALFHAEHKNMAQSEAIVDMASLNKARQKMRAQKDVNGGYVLTQPQYLVVSTLLEGDAEALVASMTYRPAADSEIKTPDWVKGLVVIADPRLDDSSEEDWYLLSNPRIAPVVKLLHLQGYRFPRVETETNFDTESIKFKVVYDVGAAAVGWQGAVKTIYGG